MRELSFIRDQGSSGPLRRGLLFRNASQEKRTICFILVTNLPGSFELLFPILFTRLPSPPQMLLKCPPRGGRHCTSSGSECPLRDWAVETQLEPSPFSTAPAHLSSPPEEVLLPRLQNIAVNFSFLMERHCKRFFFFFLGYTLTIPHLTPSSPRPRSCSQDTGVLGEPSTPAFLSSLSSSPASSLPYWMVTQLLLQSLTPLFSLLIIFSTLPVSSFGWSAKMSVTPGSLPMAHHFPLLFLELPILSKYV